MLKHTIRGKAEETECDHCGAPLYNGDALYQNSLNSSRGYCSRRCAKYEGSDEEHNRDRAERIAEDNQRAALLD